MSKARKIADCERTETMTDLVHRMYFGGHDAMSLSHVVIEEVAPSTGWGRRWADVLALGVWQSGDLKLVGYEVKASRADLKREIADLEKHRAVARYCNEWWLVAWDEKVLEAGEVPNDWGIRITTENADGERELKTIREATPLTPEVWPRSFVCSLVRNAFQQSPGAAYLARAITETVTRIARDVRRTTKEEERRRVDAELKPLREILFGRDQWSWPGEASTIEKTVVAAIGKMADSAEGVA